MCCEAHHHHHHRRNVNTSPPPGKSSLISTYVSQIFSPVPPKMIPILVPPSHALPSVRATILDSSTADPIDLNGIDSVVLVYDLHRQSTFESLERVYLPIIAERNIPTILCASKVDKVSRLITRLEMREILTSHLLCCSGHESSPRPPLPPLKIQVRPLLHLRVFQDSPADKRALFNEHGNHIVPSAAAF